MDNVLTFSFVEHSWVFFSIYSHAVSCRTSKLKTSFFVRGGSGKGIGCMMTICTLWQVEIKGAQKSLRFEIQVKYLMKSLIWLF